MIIAKIQVSGSNASLVSSESIPAGIVGAQIQIDYAADIWQRLQKTVIFQGAVTKDVLTNSSIVTVPPEVVAKANVNLSVGVYGTDANGSIAVPTIWARLGTVRRAASPSGDTTTDPTLPVWAQIQTDIGNLGDLDTTDKSSLVAAVNEALTKGGGEVDPVAVQKIVDDYLKANPPQAGSDGKDGITPTIGENGNWFLGSTDTGKPSRGAPGAAGTPGKDGTDGKDGAPGKDGADGHTPAITAEKSGKVTTVKADGTTIATINDGADGTNGADGAPGKDGSPGAAGRDGTTPTIGDNGNWYLGDTDTGKPSRGAAGAKGADGADGKDGAKGDKGDPGDKGDKGDAFTYADFTAEQLAALKGEKGDKGAPGEKGDKGDPGEKGNTGADGKSAYQYAQDGGYTGTETDFMAKLAQEILSGTTDDLTPAQVYAAVSAGRPVKVQYTSSSYGAMSFAAFNIAETVGVIAAQNIVYYNYTYILAELGGYIQSGQWFFNSTVLAEKKDIPTVPSSLKNPNALTIKIGSTTVTYDGSTAQTVTIADGTEVSY